MLLPIRTTPLAISKTPKEPVASAKSPAAASSTAASSPAPVALTAAESKAFTDFLLEQIDDAKAEETVTLDVRGKTSMADALIITSGRSNTHVGSIADKVLRAMKEAGYPAPRVEGMPHNDWVLIDTFDVIVHIFRPDVRRFYNLEKMWGLDRPDEARTAETKLV